MASSSPISSLQPAVVYVNPAAGGGRALACLPKIRKIFEMASVPVEFITVRSFADLETNAHAAIDRGEQLLIALGGDGTFQALVNAAYGSEVILGVLPAGGGNDFAAALQIPEDPVEATEAILRAQPKRVDLVRARTANGRVRLYLGGGGLGMDAEASRHANGAFRHLPGRSRYIVSALRAFCAHRSIRVRVEFPQSDFPPMEVNSLLAAVLNTPTYGAGIRLAPNTLLDDGWLDVVIVADHSVLQIMALLPRLLKSGELRTPRVKRFRIQTVKFTTDRPCTFHGDGELLGPTPVEIEVVPQAVRVLAPEQK